MYRTLAHSPFVCIVLDGWGYLETAEHNAISAAKTPFWHHLWKTYPHTLVEASGLAVGLPKGQMGNSEVGHLHLAAGRCVLQDLTRINLSISSGEFNNNPVFLNMFHPLLATNRALHILGLLSPGGVHSHIMHIQAMLKLAVQKGLKKIYLHLFLDGRDTPPQSARASLVEIETLCQSLGCGKIVSLIGRYYAMDRDKRWERTQIAYDLITSGKSIYQAETAIAGLEKAYRRGETDEFVQATVVQIAGENTVTIENGDAVVFMNFRADRARQLTRVFIDPHFHAFHRAIHPTLSCFVSLTEYDAPNIPAEVAYPPIPMGEMLGKYISNQGYKQLRIAETEKYAHVTFFFNGGEEKPYPGEDRILVPSPKVATYDLCPAMSAVTITDNLVEAIASRRYAFILCNFANPDMLGHTGQLPPTIQAIETIDACLERVITMLQSVGGEALITADHGNAECMFNPATQQPHTAHTSNLVPVIYVGRPAHVLTQCGFLYDIAPTMLHLMGLKKPKVMQQGRTLFSIQ